MNTNTYDVWHVDCTIDMEANSEEERDSGNEVNTTNTLKLNE